MIQDAPTTSRRKTVIAVTGSFAGGKSTFCKALESLGAAVVDADRLAREESVPGAAGLTQLVQHFGTEILAPDGTLDRRRLGAIIFGDQAARKAAESILHPLIRVRWLKHVNHFRGNNHPDAPRLLAYAIPLLFESGRAYPEIDQTVAVVTPPELTIARAMARDNLSRAEIQARLDAQLPYDEKCRRADICVMNTGTIEELQTKARSLLEQLVQQ